MIMSMRFSVLGEAKPKGSTRAFYNAKSKKTVTVGANAGTKAWEQRVATEAQKAVLENGIFFTKEQPVHITILFYLPRPKSMSPKVSAHVKRPDLDKLVRAVLDGMTGIVYVDDSQVVQLNTLKDYSHPDSPPRAEISIC